MAAINHFSEITKKVDILKEKLPYPIMTDYCQEVISTVGELRDCLFNGVDITCIDGYDREYEDEIVQDFLMQKIDGCYWATMTLNKEEVSFLKVYDPNNVEFHEGEWHEKDFYTNCNIMLEDLEPEYKSWWADLEERYNN